MPRILLSFLSLVFALSVFGQGTQTIRGRVTDAEIFAPLVGVNIVLLSDTTQFVGTTTDLDGYYRFDGLTPGRHTLLFRYVGYQERLVANVILNSGKETILDVKLEESAETLDEIEITAETKQGEALNDMATVSARAFTIEETDRYAGSRGDPARMASNFAGVGGADDSRNDIVVRGNSPTGVLFRLEGVDIPNPNHFAIAGSGGGPVSILNNKVLGNSDFYTSAFPAEFGNGLAGVFDLRMRPGNNEKHEFTGQFGFLGTELSAEGPINKEKRSSYLVNYRYSTLNIFTSAGIDIGTTAVPRYQDGAFKLNFPNKKGGLSIFGVGGISKIDIKISDQVQPEVEIFGEQNKDQFFSTGMGVIGANYTRSLTDKSYLRVIASASHEYQNSYHEQVYRHVNAEGLYVIDSLPPFMRYKFAISKYSGHVFVNQKVNKKNTVKVGLMVDAYNFFFRDTLFDGRLDPQNFTFRWNYEGTAMLTRAYALWKHKFSDKLVLNAGLHSMYASQGDALSPIEPRVGLRWEASDRTTLALGYGLHSQQTAPYLYFYLLPGQDQLHNENIGLSKSHHVVGSFDRVLSKSSRIKVEAYYQSLFNIPVERRSSSFSAVNIGSGFSRLFPDTLVNEGTAYNYGVELTVEKFFSQKFFFMITASLFESKYKGSDGVTRSSDWNGNWIFNVLGGREFVTGERSSLSLGAKVTAAGGRRYSPVDTAASAAFGEIIFVDSLRNTDQLRDYFRADLKINYKINAKKVTHEIGLDLVNILNTKNVLKLTYAPDPTDPSANAIREEYQLGFLPVFYYRIDF